MNQAIKIQISPGQYKRAQH